MTCKVRCLPRIYFYWSLLGVLKGLIPFFRLLRTELIMTRTVSAFHLYEFHYFNSYILVHLLATLNNRKCLRGMRDNLDSNSFKISVYTSKKKCHRFISV
ncbi:hypothetical protein BT96DRAFT_702595 [Gymnopus androsaceus JB14]|uniref:Uncharacterized protein n=1 Tax=Gymnopus androsaceus JB14 TaxID=1447944 RepID=A0A6A4HN98_9AGAR|nr:hypothetical protein BT96DRAFT_702595 [Gymnopus androsaceus JB14]